MKKIFALLGAAVILAGNAYAAEIKSVMDKTMDSWLGVSIDTVIKYWGEPSSEAKTSESHFYYWTTRDYTGSYSGAFQPYLYCERTLLVDNKGIVKNWQHHGSNCPDKYDSAKKWINPYNDPWNPIKPADKKAKKTAAAKTKTKTKAKAKVKTNTNAKTKNTASAKSAENTRKNNTSAGAAQKSN